MIDILPEDRYEELRPIFEAEGCDLPEYSQSNILFKADKYNKIDSFIVVEHLLRVGQIYNESEDKTVPRQFIRYLLKNIPENSSVVVIATDEKYESLCEKLGMREVKGKLFRRDF
jgi:hypothetical protein